MDTSTELDPFDRIHNTLTRHREIAATAQTPDFDFIPEYISVGPVFFIDWYNWCLPRDYDYRQFEGIEIVISPHLGASVGVVGSKKYGRKKWSKQPITAEQWLQKLLEYERRKTPS